MHVVCMCVVCLYVCGMSVVCGMSQEIQNGHHVNAYGVDLVSRIDKIIGLFCNRALLKRQYSGKETYNLIDPTNRSHPISIC